MYTPYLSLSRYVNTANTLIESNTDAKQLKDLTPEQIITSYQDNVGLFNNVAQSYNHAFYWKCMKPNGGGVPGGMLADAIKKDFGSYDTMRKEMESAALTAFASGWAWLCYDKEKQKLVVTKTIGKFCCL